MKVFIHLLSLALILLIPGCGSTPTPPPPLEIIQEVPEVEFSLTAKDYQSIRQNTQRWVDQISFENPPKPNSRGDISGASWLQKSEYSYQIARILFQKGERNCTWDDLLRLILNVCQKKGSVDDWTHQRMSIPRNIGWAMAYAHDYIQTHPENALGQEVMAALPKMIAYLEENLTPWARDDVKGSNLVSISVARMLIGTALEDISQVQKAYADVYITVTPAFGDGVMGLWPDYSWNQHPVGEKLQAYWSNYGMVWIDQIRFWQKFTAQTPAAFTGDFRDALFDAITKGFSLQIAGAYRNPLQAGRESNSKEGYLSAYALVSILKELNTLGTFSPSQSADIDELIHECNIPSKGIVGRTLSRYFPQTLALSHSKRGKYSMFSRMASQNNVGPEQGIYYDVYNIHLADGAVLIAQNPMDWHIAKPCIQWYAIPGATAINSYEGIPTQANYENFGHVNTFAGGVQKGRSIAQSFFLNRDQSWHYNTAFKSILTEDDITILEGSAVSIKPGFSVPQGNEIWTTFTQNLAKGKIIANLGNGPEEVPLGTVRDLRINQAVWFHHQGMGYVIIPQGMQILKMWHESRSGNWNQAASHMGGENATENIFQLSLNHGSNPQGDAYRCIIFKDITLEEMENQMQNLPEFLTVSDQEKVHAVRFPNSKIHAIFREGNASFSIGSDTYVASAPCTLIMEEKDSRWEVQIADAQLDFEGIAKSLSFQRNDSTYTIDFPKGSQTGFGTSFSL